MKRLTVAAIITVVAAGVFTGCGNAGTTQMNSATGTTAESQNSQDAGTQSSAQSDDQNAAGTTDQTGSNSGTQDIGEDAALQAALEAAGVSESDASRLRISKDRDDGRVVYEIRFDVDQTEYDYDVLASDGQILSSDVELRNDDGDDDDDRNRGSNADVAISRGRLAGKKQSILLLQKYQGQQRVISGLNWTTTMEGTNTKGTLSMRE